MYGDPYSGVESRITTGITSSWRSAAKVRDKHHWLVIKMISNLFFRDSDMLTFDKWTVAKPFWQRPSMFIPGWPFIDEVFGGTLESTRHIHGAMRKLPRGYEYTIVPPNAVITDIFPTSSTTSTSIHLARSRDFIKVLVALFQLVYSSWTLYEARGDQIDRFGYVAFSLTVAPYVVMSVINLVGGLLAPVYPALFLVRSDVMDEIEHQYGRFFDGTVGTLQQNPGSSILIREPLAGENPELALVLAGESTPSTADPQIIIPACAPFQCKNILPHFLPDDTEPGLLNFLAIIVGILIPVLIIYHLSRFHHGRSSKAQRVWITTWLAFGWGLGIAFGSILSDSEGLSRGEMKRLATLLIFMRVFYSAPAIGGLVVVGQMIKEYGDCKRF